MSELSKKTKINPRITAKRLAHLQTMMKTYANFQKDTALTVGRVAFTRFCDGQSDGQTVRRTHGENNMSPDPDGGDILTHSY